MFCPKCGTQNPETGKFCRSCGTDLGTVSAALSGNLKPTLAPATPAIAPVMLDRRGRRMNWESALTKVFMGVAFLVVSIVLGVSGMGRGWWFWLLIPAFAMLGSGIAQCVQLKKCEQNPALSSGSQPAAAAASQNEIPAAQTNAALPPTQTDYVKPPRASIYDTGELYEKPPSVTESTTRHLEINNEGETMTLPKK